MHLGLGLYLVCTVVCRGLLCDERNFIGNALERWLVYGLQFFGGWLSFLIAVMCDLPVR